MIHIVPLSWVLPILTMIVTFAFYVCEDIFVRYTSR
jgi:hypothetical protein